MGSIRGLTTYYLRDFLYLGIIEQVFGAVAGESLGFRFDYYYLYILSSFEFSYLSIACGSNETISIEAKAHIESTF